MGRFETAADFYHYREPYPREFFETVAATLGLARQTRMLDVGCGPGNLAIGFEPYVGSITAIDVEPEMLRVAAQAAQKAQAHIAFKETKVEDLVAADGAFDFVTIGRALHWLSPPETLAVFDRIVASGGSIAICGSFATDAPANAWNVRFQALRREWSPDRDESRYKPDMDLWFAPSHFRRAEEISVVHQQKLTIPDLIGRGLSFSMTSPAALGDRRTQFEMAIEEALTPFAKDGTLEEQLVARATVFR